LTAQAPILPDWLARDSTPADLLLYYFRVDQPGGFGHTRHYSPERGYDSTYTVWY